MCTLLCTIIFSVSIPFLLVVLAVIIANLSKIIPVTPGGLEVYEAVLAVTLTLGGVPVTIAALIAIIDHLLINLVPVVGGIFSMYYFGDWTRTLVKKTVSR